MSEEAFKEKYEAILKGVYDICVALVSITEFECSQYGFENEIASARKFIENYEAEH